MNEIKQEWMGSTGTPSRLRRFGRWLFSWRAVRFALFGVLGLATLGALAAAVENWRGQRAWDNYRRAAEARGEKLDFKDFIPPAVPEAENFAFSPYFEGLMVRDAARGVRLGGTNWVTSMYRLNLHKNDLPEKSKFHPDTPYRNLADLPRLDQNALVDLAAWQAFFRGNTNYVQPAVSRTPAEDVLATLEGLEKDMAPLREAARRPYYRFPLAYDGDPFQVLLPHLAMLKSIFQVSRLRAVALLECGRVEEAYAEVQFGLRLVELMRQEPFVISLMVRQASLGQVLAAIREGVERGRWSAEQSSALQQQMAGINLLEDYQQSLKAERAFGARGLDCMRQTAHQGLNPLQTAVAKVFYPLGWLQQGQVAIAKMYTAGPLNWTDARAQRVYPDRIRGYVQEQQKKWRYNPYTVMARALMGSFTQTPLKNAQAQTRVNFLRLALALDRCRKARGHYPETLEALAPEYIEALPHDLINGQPLHYRREGDAGYVLYSVASDGSDDGGKKVRNSLEVLAEKGDWVWRSPATLQPPRND